jgi:hypothetical protein
MAIQVSGTEVISNARALNNIASVDATTAASIGAAGVGGAMELLQTTSITTDIAYIEYTFPAGYSAFMILLNGMRRQVGGGFLDLRLTNSGGTLLTGATDYYNMISPFGSPGSSDRMSDVAYMSYDGATNGTSSVIWIYNPLKSDTVTLMWSQYSAYVQSSAAYFFGAGKIQLTNMGVAQANTKVRIYAAGSPEIISGNSSGYQIYGVKNA